MKKRSKILVYIILLIAIGCTSNESPKKKSISQSPKNTFEFNSDSISLLYSKNVDSLLIGEVGAITIANNNIYLLDTSNNGIIEIDKNNSIQAVYSLGYGRGPGEAVKPNSLFVDNFGFIYLTDRDARKFIILDKNGKLVSSKILKMMPAKIAAFDTSQVFVTGFRFSYPDTNIVWVYSNVNNEYQKMGSIGKRSEVKNEMMLNMSGYSDYITIAENKLFLNRFFPYHMEIFDQKLNNIVEKKRELNFFTAPYREDGLIKIDAVGREVLPLKDYFLIRYLVKGNSYFDIYDKNLNLLESSTGINWNIIEGAKYFTSDISSNEIYAVYENPSLSLIKYTLNEKN